MSSLPICEVYRLGSMDFASARRLQSNLAKDIAVGERPAALLVLEHPHTYTFGRLGEGFLEDFRIYKRELYYSEIKNFITNNNMPEMVSNEKIPHLKSPKFNLPISNVFVNGSEGYSCFRIPALIRAGNGEIGRAHV